MKFKARDSELQKEFSEIAAHINDYDNFKNPGTIQNLINAGSYIKNLVWTDPMREVSEKDKQFLESIRKDLEQDIGTHQAFISSMYELWDRVQEKLLTVSKLSYILNQNVSMKKKHSNEFNFYNKNEMLKEEIDKNFDFLIENFKLLQKSTGELVFK